MCILYVRLFFPKLLFRLPGGPVAFHLEIKHFLTTVEGIKVYIDDVLSKGDKKSVDAKQLSDIEST